MSSRTPERALDPERTLELLQQQQQMMMTMLQDQQRLQSELTRQNEQLLERALAASRPTTTQPRIPASSLPDRAEYDMSMPQWRIWKRDMLQFASLSGWNDSTTVLNIRLRCDDKLKRILEAEHGDSWEQLTTEEALTALEAVLRTATNPAREKDKFHHMQQMPGETGKSFMHRCEQQALECDFQCPNCHTDISEWCVRDRVLAGLRDDMLKIDLYQNADKYPSLSSLMAKVELYEAATPKPTSDGHIAANMSTEDVPPALIEAADGNGSLLAALQSTYKRVTRAKRIQNQVHHRGDVSTAVAGKVGPKQGQNIINSRNRRRSVQCYQCGGKGHFRSQCPSEDGLLNTVEESPVRSADVSGVSQSGPTLNQFRSSVNRLHVRKGVANGEKLEEVEVTVVPTNSRQNFKCLAIADTGAECCVAGPKELAILGLRVRDLDKPSSTIRHAGGGALRVFGTKKCTLRLGDRSTDQNVHFIQGIERMFLSVKTCKSLGLVDAEFPHHIQHPTRKTIANMEAETGACQDEGMPSRPGQLPYAPTEENVEQLEQFLKQQFATTVFNTGAGKLPAMSTTPHKIHLLPGAVPHVRHTPIPVSKHWEAEVKAQLDEDVRRGVLEKVPTGEPSVWCAQMVVVPKANGQPRRVVDLQELSKWCQRETHHTRPPFDMISSVPSHCYKTKLDAFWGFHQVPLAVESRSLTTFITPWGRYRYLRTPMGHSSASDAYTKRYDDAVLDIPRKFKCVDDVLLYDSSVEQAFWHCWEYLETCARARITLSPDKFSFCKKEVDFVGYRLGWESYRPSPEKLASIASFPMPDKPSITDIRSFVGLINQMAPFMATAAIMEPLRDLLKNPQSKKVYWDEQLKRRLEEIKMTVSKLVEQGLRYYDKTRPTILMTDWSKAGIGFVVLQQWCDCSTLERPACCPNGWKLALCGSRFLTPTEQRYAAVEGEALAIVWALQKARLFLLGCPNLEVITDHRPLVKIFSDRELKGLTNPRLFRLKEKTLLYKFTIRYRPGRLNSMADVLSRYPVERTAPSAADSALEEELTVAAVSSVQETVCALTVDQETVRQAASTDDVYQMVRQRVRDDSWPNSCSQENSELKPFFKIRDRLCLVDNLLCYTFDGGPLRLVIPSSLREQVTQNLHAAHQGAESMLRRARQSVYWPGFEGDVENSRRQCSACDSIAPAQSAEPLIMTPPPDYPFQQVVTDLMMIRNRHYLVYADRLTGWIRVDPLRSFTSSALMPILHRYFCQHGVPEQISIDGGTSLTSCEMKDFFRRWGVEIRQSSAHYPQSNGRAEAAVKTAKRILRENVSGTGTLATERVVLAFLQYHNTPLRDGGKSPAQLLLGRQLRSGVPVPGDELRISQHWTSHLGMREKEMARRGEILRDETKFSRTLPKLSVGQLVRVQDPVTKRWDRTGVVTRLLRPIRQYTVRLDGSGRLVIRNRKFLRPIGPSAP